MMDLHLSQVGIIAALGGFVGIGFLYVRRIEAGPAAGLWALAWLAFFVSLVTSVIPSFPTLVIAHVTGTAFPTCLLLGAFAFVGRAAPGWILPAGLIVGGVRGLGRYFEIDWVPSLGVYLFEAPVDLFAAWVMLGARRGLRRSPGVGVLAVFLAAFSVLEISNDLMLAGGRTPSLGYFGLGVVATLGLSLTQMLALLESARIRHVEDLELLRSIAQSGTLAGDVAGLAAHVLDVLRERLGLDAGALWQLDPAGDRLEHAHGFEASSGREPSTSVVGAAGSTADRVLRRGESIYLHDRLHAPEIGVEEFLPEAAVRSCAVIPLRHGSATLGLLVIGRAQVRPFDGSERHILRTAATEFALAIEHVQAVQRLASERRVLAAVVETSPTGILVAGRSGRVQLVNSTFDQHTGQPEGRSWLGAPVDRMAVDLSNRFLDPPTLVPVFEQSDDAAPITVRATLIHPVERELLVFTAPILSEGGRDVLGRVWVTRDVSEEHRLEAQLRQSQKMETLGTLAGGVAHDFNNQLTAILGNTRLLLSTAEEGSGTHEALSDVAQAAEHCANLTRSLLSFSRRAPLATEVVLPEHVVEQLGGLLRSLLPATIEFKVTIEGDLPALSADATQLQQILINLVVNARDAVDGEGTIQLSVRRCQIDRPRNEDAAPGAYVEFVVSDDGRGMDELTLARIFEPFFTTKGVSQGTGLGLAVVYGAARSHGGWVEVESELGRGSAFRVLIPAADLDDAPQTEPTVVSPTVGKERILVADDEEKLRRLVGRVLRQYGYDTIEVADGREAVAVFEAEPDAIDIALIDITMPNLDGISALERIRRIRPDLPAILVSGLLEVKDDILSQPETEYLSKPYDLDEVMNHIRQLLDGRSTRSG